MEQYYGEYILIPYPAQWKVRPKVFLSTKTASDETPLGERKAASEWHAVRRAQSWTIESMTIEQTDQIAETLRMAQQNKKAAAPYFLAMRTIVAIDGNTITLAAEPDGDLYGSIWWSGEDFGSANGICQIESTDGAEITLIEMPEGMEVGGFVAPMILGVLSKVKEKEVCGATRRWTVTIESLAGDINGTLRDTDDALAMAMDISGHLHDKVLNRDESETMEMAVEVSGQLIDIVINTNVSDAMDVDLDIEGDLIQKAFNTDTEDELAMDLGITGYLI